MTNRERLSATVEGELLAAGRAAVDDGRADSLSAWVNAALRRQAEHDQRIKALDDFLRAYEAEHGEISADEIEQASRRARARAVVVRTPPSAPTTSVPATRADTAKTAKTAKPANPAKVGNAAKAANPAKAAKAVKAVKAVKAAKTVKAGTQTRAVKATRAAKPARGRKRGVA